MGFSDGNSWFSTLRRLARKKSLGLVMVLMIFPGVWEKEGFSSERSTPSMEAGAKAKTDLVIGKVTDNPKKHYRTLKPMADYVVNRMKGLGITEARVLMARDNDRMVEYLQQGKVDWVTETVFSAVVYQQRAGAEILVKKWKKGVPDYHVVFFCRKDSKIKNLGDLKGKKIALEDPGSTTAFFYPAVAFIRENIPMLALDSPMDPPAQGRVGYVFCGQEINISTLVFRRVVDAGAFNNLDWEKDDHIRAVFREDMRIFHEMPPVPRAIELVRKDLDPAIKETLKTILLQAHTDPAAKSALTAYQRTARFEGMDSGDKAEIENIRHLLDRLEPGPP
jgi:phosphonate transport system substrate-binding protein